MEEGGGESETPIQNIASTADTEDVIENADDTNVPDDAANENKPEIPMEQQSAGDKTEKVVSRNPEERLCGCLYQKSRGIGNIKTYKQRWYQFGEENCKLYCYRDPYDILPLYEINIAIASFDFECASYDRPGLFQIKSDGKDYVLDAGNRQKMFYWLQALQMKRREFNLSRVCVSTDRVGHWSMKRISNQGGLIKAIGLSTPAHEPAADLMSDLPEIRVPDSDTQSGSSSLNSLPPAATSNKPPLWALNNLKMEISQKWQGLKLPGRPNREVPQKDTSDTIFYCDVKSKDNSETKCLSTINTAIDSAVDCDGKLLEMSPADFTASGEHNNDVSKPSSDLENSLEKMDSNDSLLRPGAHSANQGNTRNTASWEVITKKEVTNAQLSELDLPNSASAGTSQTKHTPASRNLSSQNTNSSVGQSLNQGQSSGQGQSQSQSQSSCQGSEEGGGKAAKILSTFSTLKRLGRKHQADSTAAKKGTSSNAPAATSKPAPKPEPGGSGYDGPVGRDVCDLEDELQANKEVITVLQQKLLEFTREQQTREAVNNASDEERAAMLIEKDQKILSLQTQLDNTRQEVYNIEEKYKTTETELVDSREKMTMLEDMLKAKEEAISSLSVMLFKSEHEKEDSSQTNSFDQPDVIQSMSSRDSATSAASERVELRELDRYKDMCQGYEFQHKFLTKEILELNDLRKDDLAREKKLMMDFAKMQAKYYQIKSKYYVLLKQQKEQNPVREGEHGQEVVSQLLQDAFEADPDDIEHRLTGSIEEYDKYGFSRKHYMIELEEELEEDPLTNRAAQLERQSEELNTKVKDANKDASLRVKWENFMVGRAGKLQKCQELKALVRQGVPHEYREEVWRW